MKISSQGWTISAVAAPASRTAQLTVTQPDGSIDNVNLSDVSVAGNTLTATGSVAFFDLDLAMNLTGNTVSLNISHSWFADGDHTFPLVPADVAQVQQFMRGFAP